MLFFPLSQLFLLVLFVGVVFWCWCCCRCCQLLFCLCFVVHAALAARLVVCVEFLAASRSRNVVFAAVAASCCFPHLPRLLVLSFTLLLLLVWLSCSCATQGPQNAVRTRTGSKQTKFVPHAPVPTPHSPLPTPHSPFPPLPSPHSPVPTPTPHFPLPAPHSPFPIPHSPVPSPHSPLVRVQGAGAGSPQTTKTNKVAFPTPQFPHPTPHCPRPYAPFPSAPHSPFPSPHTLAGMGTSETAQSAQ